MVPRFENTDRNIVSVIQRETMVNCIDAVSQVGGYALNIGGPMGEWAGRSIPIDCVRSYQNLGTEAERYSSDILAMGERLPIRSDSIGTVFSCHSLEHMIDAEIALREWMRVLVPWGILAIIVPLKEFHLHDPEVKKLGERAPSEHTASEFKDIVDRVIKKCDGELLLFNTRRNNFDLDIVIKKNSLMPCIKRAKFNRRQCDLLPKEVYYDILACPICRSSSINLSDDFSTKVSSDARMTCKNCNTVYAYGNFLLEDTQIKELWRKDDERK